MTHRARAAILLMGDSGLRRDDAANARRENIRASPMAAADKAKRTVGAKGEQDRGGSNGAPA
jgi:hypothetical protein